MHPFHNELIIDLGVRGSDGSTLCAVEMWDQDRSGSGELRLQVDAAPCAAFWPPGASGTTWFLHASDIVPFDAGTVDTFSVEGVDGSGVYAPSPVGIPDGDPAGVRVDAF